MAFVFRITAAAHHAANGLTGGNCSHTGHPAGLCALEPRARSDGRFHVPAASHSTGEKAKTLPRTCPGRITGSTPGLRRVEAIRLPDGLSFRLAIRGSQRAKPPLWLHFELQPGRHH
jgi:hypothetical protein